MSAYEEIVSAVHTKATEFDAHLGKLKHLNAALVARSADVLQALRDLVGSVVLPPKKNACCVCCTREQRSACVPCGHVFCGSCADRAKRASRCHTCRQPVDETIRIYL